MNRGAIAPLAAAALIPGAPKLPTRGRSAS
jgi:hypothetical protein